MISAENGDALRCVILPMEPETRLSSMLCDTERETFHIFRKDENQKWSLGRK